MTVQIALVAGVRLETEHGAADQHVLAGAHARLLAAVLISERHRSIGHDELAGILWPDRLPVSWEHSLLAIASEVRTFLTTAGLDGTAALRDTAGSYQLLLPPPVEVDIETAVLAIRAAQAALSAGDAGRALAEVSTARLVLARPLLPGLDAPWLEAKRGELRSWRRCALEVAGDARLALGEPALAVPLAEEAVALEPLLESGHRRLVRAHAATGDRSEALRAHERCLQLLAGELDVAPDSPTRALRRELFGDAAPDTPTAPPDPKTRPHRAKLPPTLSGSVEENMPFVGRGTERAALHRAWEAAAGGQRRLVLLSGEAGIGKTRLAAELARDVAGAGGLVRHGRCEPEPGAPFQPFRDVLGTELAELPDAALPARLGPLAGELAVWEPALAHRIADLAPPLPAEPETERHRLFEAVAGWLEAAGAAAPLLLVIDDLQWAGTPTLLLLRHLLRAPRPGRLLVVATVRDDEMSIEGLLADRLPGVTHVSLGGLTEDDVVSIVEGYRGSSPPRAQELARRLHTDTGGNPFFLLELMRQLDDMSGGDDAMPIDDLDLGVPAGVRAALARRLARLPDQGVALLRTAAVLGTEFEVSLLVAVAAVGEDEVLDIVDRALAAGLLLPVPGQPDRCAFAHALVRATLADGLAPPRRVRLHLRVLETLEARGDAQVPELAHHACAAAAIAGVDRAVGYARRAGAAATADRAFEEAAAHYDRGCRALALARPVDVAARCDLATLRGEALDRAGDPRHRAVLLAAAADARALADAERLGRIALVGGMHNAGVVDSEVVELLEAALAGLGRGDTALRALLLSKLSSELVYGEQLERRTALAAEALDIARRMGDQRTLARVLANAQLTPTTARLPAHKLADADELRDLGRVLGDLEVTCWAELFRNSALVELGRLDVAAAALDTADTLADELHQPFFRWHAMQRRAGLLLLQGDLAGGEKTADAALALGIDIGLGASLVRAAHSAHLVSLRYEQGELGQLVEAITALVEAQPGLQWRVILGWIQTELGRLDAAAATLAPVLESGVEAVTRSTPWLGVMLILAEACAALGAVAPAATLRPILTPFTGHLSWTEGSSQGPVDLALARLAAVCGDDTAARGHAAAAAQLCRAAGAPRWLARAETLALG